MEIKDTFEALALAQSKPWGFEYSRNDYQNLIDSTDFIADALNTYATDETILFMDPVVEEINSRDVETYSGSFMVLTRSDLDLTYDERLTKFIEPIRDLIKVGFRNKLKCTYDVNTWRLTEVINAFDWNADGLLVTYNLSKP